VTLMTPLSGGKERQLNTYRTYRIFYEFISEAEYM